LVGKSPDIRSYTVYIYVFGQLYKLGMWQYALHQQRALLYALATSVWRPAQGECMLPLWHAF